MKQRRPPGPPHRRVSRAAARLDLLIFVEGKLTEEHYLREWHRRHRNLVTVEIGDFRGAPLQLVQAAVDAKRLAEREERRGRGRAHDQIWCVFDRGEHPNLSAAFALAEANGIRIAFSNPCLELWFLLHFRDQHGYIDRHMAQRIASQLLGCSKALTASALDVLVMRYEDARRRPVYLHDKHQRDGSPRHNNPSSGMWQLIDAIRTGGAVDD